MTDKVQHKLREFLHSHPRLYYIFGFFKHLRSTEFFIAANPNDKECGRLQFNTYGELNKGIIINYIHINTSWGFMSFFMWTAEQLSIGDHLGFVPVIEWKALQFQKDADGSNKDTNLFEYFFERPNNISVLDVKRSHMVTSVKQCRNLFGDEDKPYFISNEKVMRLHNAVAKNLKLNSETQEHISDKIEKTLNNKKTLAIHVRGGAFSYNAQGHPIAITTAEFISEAKNAINEFKFEQIFLATDEQEVIERFADAFGREMITYHNNVLRRAPKDTMPAELNALLSVNMRTDNRYLMALEVLTDAYTLAACSGLIAGSSNVAFASQIINGNKYEYKKIIHKGIAGVDGPSVPLTKIPHFSEYLKAYNKLKKNTGR